MEFDEDMDMVMKSDEEKEDILNVDDVEDILHQLQARGILKAETVNSAVSIIENVRETKKESKEEKPDEKDVSTLDRWQEDNVEVEKPLEKEQTSVEDNTSDNEENKASQVEIPDLEEIPDEVEDLPEEPEKEEVKPAPKRRGRPRKNPLPENTDDAPKKKRGRPKKKVEVSNQLEFSNDESQDDLVMPGINSDVTYTNNNISNNYIGTNMYNNNLQNVVNTEVDISSLLTPDKKIACFIGTSKNGTSFIVNNVAQVLASQGVSTAILDMTQNRNAYYIYTNNEEELRNTAMNCFQNLIDGVAKGIQANRNLTVYTALPNDNDNIENAGEILQTLIKNYSVVLIDCDYSTPISYFSYAQEIYLVQSMDVLTIQPLTAFLNVLKSRNVLDEKKLRIVLNKTEKLRKISDKVIIGGMSSYNDPAMTYMVELFDKNLIKYISIPFDEQVYVKYLEGLIDCEISLRGYPKNIVQILTELANMLYKNRSGKSTYRPPTANSNGFTPSINSTLEQMRKY